MSSEKLVWAITVTSAYRAGVTLVLGDGETECAAWSDAYGEAFVKLNTFSQVKRFIQAKGNKGIYSRQLTAAELYELECEGNEGGGL